jgi:hypothetical protein
VLRLATDSVQYQDHFMRCGLARTVHVYAHLHDRMIACLQQLGRLDQRLRHLISGPSQTNGAGTDQVSSFG